MPAPKIKKPVRHQSHAEKTAADFEPVFKSLAASSAIMESLRTGLPAKVVGARQKARA